MKFSRLLLLVAGFLLLIATIVNYNHVFITGSAPDLAIWYSAKLVFALGLVLLIFDR